MTFSSSGRPGDPGLITACGLELIRDRYVLVYHRLVADELVAEAPAEAIPDRSASGSARRR